MHVISVQEILAMKSRLEEYEKEAAQLREMRDAQEREAKAIAAVAGPADSSAMETEDDKQAADERSVYVGNVSACAMNKNWTLVYCSLSLHRSTIAPLLRRSRLTLHLAELSTA